MTRLRSAIDAGKPFIAPVNHGPWRALTATDYDLGRFVVVVGYDALAVYVHDPLLATAEKPADGAYLRVPTELFLAGWGGFDPSVNPNWVGIYPSESIASPFDPDGEALKNALDDAHANHYERAVQAVVVQTGVSELAVRDWFDQQLISEDGTRTPVLRADQETAGLPIKAVLMTQVLGFSQPLFPYQVPPLLIGMQMAGVHLYEGFKLCLVLALGAVLAVRHV
jgi:hypothetical protein